MANERTFLAWNRTALALIGLGLAVEQFLNVGRAARLALAVPLIVLGAVIATNSYTRWKANQHALETDQDIAPSQLPMVIALCFGLFALGALVLVLVNAL